MGEPSGPEWSPNESIFKKLERLAFALIRTRPVQFQEEDELSRRRSKWVDKFQSLAGPFALSLLVSIPYLAENTNEKIIVASLLLAALDAALAVWCYVLFEQCHSACSGDIFTCTFDTVGEFPSFLVGWSKVMGFSSSLSALSRSLGSTIDCLTGRHFEKISSNYLSYPLLLGAPVDLLAFIIPMVPSVLCAMGMEDSCFLRLCLFVLTTGSTMTIFSSSFFTNNNATLASEDLNFVGNVMENSIYIKILGGASLVSVGFFGLYKICLPDIKTQCQRRHFEISKRFSLSGCFIFSVAFSFYFFQSTILNKAQPISRIWEGDPPLLWPLEGIWRICIASLSIGALSLATFEFIIPLSLSITQLANNGLIYTSLRKDSDDLEDSRWTLLTPLFFGFISSLQASLIDTRVLLALSTTSLMSIHLIIVTSMLISKYSPINLNSPSRKIQKFRQLRKIREIKEREREKEKENRNKNKGLSKGKRRGLRVSFMKLGLGGRDIRKNEEIETSGGCSTLARLSRNSDTINLMNDVEGPSFDPEGMSVESLVSGYESNESEEINDNDERDVDVVVNEYVTSLPPSSGGSPNTTTILPSSTSVKYVTLSTLGLIPCSIGLSISLSRYSASLESDFLNHLLAISSGLLIFLLLIVISRQPQKVEKKEHNTQQDDVSRSYSDKKWYLRGLSYFFTYSVIPWGPGFVVLLHSALLVEGLDLCSLPYSIWLATGLIIYFSYGVSKSVAAPLPILEIFDFEELHANELITATEELGNEFRTSISDDVNDIVKNPTVIIS